jgi:hypothetical protein
MRLRETRLRRLACVVLLLAAVCARDALAFDNRFMKDTPISNLKGEELQAYLGYLQRVLDSAPDGTSDVYTSGDKTFKSTIRFVSTQQKGDSVCRRVQIRSEAKGRSNGDNYRFCKTGPDPWRLQ